MVKTIFFSLRINACSKFYGFLKITFIYESNLMALSLIFDFYDIFFCKKVTSQITLENITLPFAKFTALLFFHLLFFEFLEPTPKTVN